MFELEFSALILLVFLLVAVWVDLKRRRIPNWLTGGMLATALGVQLIASGTSGLLAACGGMLVGFGVFILFYLMRGMAAGDVKLMTAVGAFLGPWQAVTAALVSLMAGTVLGILVMTYEYYRRRVDVPTTLSIRFPYAPAIAIGASVAILTGMSV